MASRRRNRSADERERREQQDGITRRDFLDGAAVSAAGLAMAAAAPGLTGARGDGRRRRSRRPRCPPATTRRASQTRTPACPTQVIDRTIKIDGPPLTDPSQIHSTKGGPGINKRRPRHRRAVRLRDRRRGRERDLGGEVLPGPLRPQQEDPDPRRAARLRRALAPQRVPHPQRGQRQRRRDDPAQRRHGQPRQHRDLEQGTARRASPAPTASRRSTSSPGRASTPPRPRSGRTAAPRASRPRSGSTSACCSPPPSSARDHVIPARNAGPFAGQEPGHGRGLDRLPRPHALLATRRRPAILRVQTADEDFLANAPGAPLTQAQKRDYLTAITYKQYLQRSRRRQRRGLLRRVLARLGRPARRRRPGGLGGRLLDPRPPGLPGRRRPRRHRGHPARRDRPDAVPGLALEQRPDARVARRQHLAAAAGAQQADPERVPERRRRRRAGAAGPAQHPQDQTAVRPARPAATTRPHPAQQHRLQRRAVQATGGLLAGRLRAQPTSTGIQQAPRAAARAGASGAGT